MYSAVHPFRLVDTEALYALYVGVIYRICIYDQKLLSFLRLVC